MGYVVGFGLQIPELNILFQLDIRVRGYEMSNSGKSTTLATTFFFLLNPGANMAANYICMK